MSFDFKPSVFEILPGVLTLILIAVAFGDQLHLPSFFFQETSFIVFASTLLIAFSWIMGIFFDAARNGIFENILDRYFEPIDWQSICEIPEPRLTLIEESYLIYYSLSFNLILASVSFLILWTLLYAYFDTSFSFNDVATISTAVIFIAVFFLDTKTLRAEIAAFIRRGKNNN